MSALPGSADVHFIPNTGTLYVDRMIDPGGHDVVDVDKETALQVVGRLDLPGSLSGNGTITLSADEIGGTFDQEIGRTTVQIAGSASPDDPPSMSYGWTIDVPASTFPDVSKKYYVTLVFAFTTTAGGHTDIAASYDLGTILVV